MRNAIFEDDVVGVAQGAWTHGCGRRVYARRLRGVLQPVVLVGCMHKTHDHGCRDLNVVAPDEAREWSPARRPAHAGSMR